MRGGILTAAEVAEILAVDPVVVQTMLAGGALAALVRVGGEYLIAEASVREFIAASWHRRPWEGLP